MQLRLTEGVTKGQDAFFIKKGISIDKAASSAAAASLCGMTAMAVVSKFPGMGKTNLLKSGSPGMFGDKNNRLNGHNGSTGTTDQRA